MKRIISILCVLTMLFVFSVQMCSVFAEDALKTDKTVYEEGEPIMVTATGSGKDWVGIYLRNDAVRTDVAIRWYYVADKGNTSGTAKDIRTAEDVGTNRDAYHALPAGEYTIYLLENDGYDVKSKVDITVKKAGTSSEAPVTWTQTPIADGSDGKTSPSESIVFETTTYLGVRLNLTTKTKGFNFLQWTPGGGKGHFKYKVEVFKWNTDFDTTKAGEALFAKEITTPSDGVQDIQFGKELSAGNYLILFTGLDRSIDEGSTEAIESVRMHFQTGGKLFAENNEKYFEVFTNAVASGEGITRVPLIQINVPEGTTNAFAELTVDTEEPAPDTGESSWLLSVLVLALAATFSAIYYKKRIIE